MKATIGKMVNYVMHDGSVRPMVVTAVWDGNMVDGVVFIMGMKDQKNFPGLEKIADLTCLHGTLAIPSIHFTDPDEYMAMDSEPDKLPAGTWHFMEDEK